MNHIYTDISLSEQHTVLHCHSAHNFVYFWSTQAYIVLQRTLPHCNITDNELEFYVAKTGSYTLQTIRNNISFPSAKRLVQTRYRNFFRKILKCLQIQEKQSFI